MLPKAKDKMSVTSKHQHRNSGSSCLTGMNTAVTKENTGACNSVKGSFFSAFADKTNKATGL